MDWIIRPANAEDIPEIARLEAACFSQPWSESALMSEMEKESSLLLCACKDGVLAGYCGIQTVLDEGYITNIAVFPAFRGQGAAKELVHALLEHCKTRALSFVTLEVRASNAAAIGLYSRFGFQPVGRRKAFYSHPTEDALLMTHHFQAT